MESSDARTRQQVRDLVVEKGPVTASTIARILGLTTAAVRRHLTILLSDNEIAEHEPGQVALGYLGQVGGGEAIDSFAAARSREIERRYAATVREAGSDPRLRAQALADALTADGYAATVRDIGRGGYAVQLCQGHCPIRQVAGDFPQLCEAETAAFSRLLNVHVQRLATLAGGEHVCTTNIPVSAPVISPAARAALRK